MPEKISLIRDVRTIKSIALQCIEDHLSLEEIINHLIKGNGKERYNASWILSHAIEKSPAIVNDKHHRAFLNTIQSSQEGGVRRNIIRIWQFAIPISEQLRLDVINLAIHLLSDAKQDLAVRVFSITVLEKHLPYMPEIKDEVLFMLEREYYNASASFKVRADRFIKAANKLH